MTKHILELISGVFDFRFDSDPILENTLFKDIKEEDCEKAFEYLKEHYDLIDYYRFSPHAGLSIATEDINESISEGDTFFFWICDAGVMFQPVNSTAIDCWDSEELQEYNKNGVANKSIIIRECTEPERTFKIGYKVVVANPTKDMSDLENYGFDIQTRYTVDDVSSNTIEIGGITYYKSAFSVYIPEEDRTFKTKPTIEKVEDDVDMEIPSCTSEKPVEEAESKPVAKLEPKTETVKPVEKPIKKRLFKTNTLKRKL